MQYNQDYMVDQVEKPSIKNAFGKLTGELHVPHLKEHIHKNIPREQMIGQVNIEIKEEGLPTNEEMLIPVGAGEFNGKENVLEFAVPIIEKPTNVEKAQIVFENATDKTRVTLHNAKEKIVCGVLNAGEMLKDKAEHLGNKIETLKT